MAANVLYSDFHYSLVCPGRLYLGTISFYALLKIFVAKGGAQSPLSKSKESQALASINT